jgi:hypothetical protein
MSGTRAFISCSSLSNFIRFPHTTPPLSPRSSSKETTPVRVLAVDGISQVLTLRAATQLCLNVHACIGVERELRMLRLVVLLHRRWRFRAWGLGGAEEGCWIDSSRGAYMQTQRHHKKAPNPVNAFFSVTCRTCQKSNTLIPQQPGRRYDHRVTSRGTKHDIEKHPHGAHEKGDWGKMANQ